MDLELIYQYNENPINNKKTITSQYVELVNNPISGKSIVLSPYLLKQYDFYIYDDFTYQLVTYNYLLNLALPVIPTKFYIYNTFKIYGIIQRKSSNISELKKIENNTESMTISALPPTKSGDSLLFNFNPLKRYIFRTLFINPIITERIISNIFTLIKKFENNSINLYNPTIDDLYYETELYYIPKGAVYTTGTKRIMPALGMLSPAELDNYLLPKVTTEYYIFDDGYSYFSYEILISSGFKMYNSMDAYFLIISLLLLPEFFYSFFSNQTMKEIWAQIFEEGDDIYNQIKILHLNNNSLDLYKNKEFIFNILRGRRLKVF